jgi:hypothetical protein
MTIELAVAVVRSNCCTAGDRVTIEANLISCVLSLGISSTAIGCTEI